MTCALLAEQAHGMELIDNAWQIDSGVLYYTEQDRVDVTKAIASVKGVISDSDSVTLKTVYDSMTGATPSGAVNQTTISFTGASGGGVAGGGNAPALATFTDTRIGLSMDWNRQSSRELGYVFNGAVSVENDYRSFGLGATFNRELNNKTLKLTAGIAGTYDVLFRVGSNDTPEQLSRVTDGTSLDEGEKTTVDGIVGATYIVNTRTVAQFNFGASISQGYLTDPYKIISIVDNNGVEYDQFYEKRPGSRNRYTLSMNVNHQMFPTDDIVQGSYRLYTDDWGITSHTFLGSMTIPLRDRAYWEPNFRLYRQSEADFYRNSFVQDPTDPTPITSLLPEFLSADYRLDGMYSLTLGATYGIRYSQGDHLRFRLQLIRTEYDEAEFDSMNTIVVQMSYGKRF